MLSRTQTITVIAVLISLLIIGCYFAFIKYPKNVTNEAYDSLRVGASISQYLDTNSKFFETLELANIEKIVFRTKENRICKIIENKEVHKSESYFLSQVFLQSECSKFCVNLNPSIVLRGSFCVFLKADKTIKSKETPIFWINYPETKSVF